MTTEISFREFASIKKMAQIINPLVQKKQNIIKKISALQEEIELLDTQIKGMEAGITAKFNYRTEDLVKKVITPVFNEDGSPVFDLQTGKQKTKTNWEPTDIVTYNETTRKYIVNHKEEVSTEDTTVVPTEEDPFEYINA